jgi:RNA polymerase sigma-70 factor (ECF subfamily)
MGNHSCSDQELVARFRRGCTLSFEVFVRRHEDWVYSLAFHLTGSSSHAESVMGSVFLKYWSSTELRQDDTIPLETIVKSVIQESKLLIQELPLPAAIIKEKNVEDGAADFAEQLERAVFRLPFEYRTIFVLHDVSSFGISLIARILEVSEEECRVQLKRARLMLRRVLKKNETDSAESEGFQAQDAKTLEEKPKTFL